MTKEPHEEEINSISKSPYSLDSRVIFKFVSGQSNSISPNRLSLLFKKGHLTERTVQVIQFLYEFQFLTGHLIKNCFAHPCVRPERKKLKNDAKNPYLSEIKFLIRIGAIIQYGSFDEKDTLKGSYIYGLTDGCKKWAEARFFNMQLFTEVPVSLDRNLGKKHQKYNHDILWLFSLLSLNQFHIAMTINQKNQLTRIDLSQAEYPASFYEVNETTALCAVSIRSCTCKEIPTAYVTDIPDEFYQKTAHINQKAFIIITESILAATEIWHMLTCLKWPYLDFLLFTMDYITKDGKSPLNDGLMRFTGNKNDDYEICSLHL